MDLESFWMVVVVNYGMITANNDEWIILGPARCKKR